MKNLRACNCTKVLLFNGKISRRKIGIERDTVRDSLERIVQKLTASPLLLHNALFTAQHVHIVAGDHCRIFAQCADLRIVLGKHSHPSLPHIIAKSRHPVNTL